MHFTKYIYGCFGIRVMVAVLLLAVVCPLQGQSAQECDSVINVAINEIFREASYPQAIRRLEAIEAVAAKQGYNSQHFRAVNNLGAAYYQMLDYGNAIKYYLKAYNIAIENRNVENEMSVLNNIAIVYAKEGNRKAAREYFVKSYTIAHDKKITSRISLYASNIAQLSLEDGNLEAAKKYTAEALQYLGNNPAVELNSKTTLAQILFKEARYADVIATCNILIAKARASSLPDQESELQLLLAKAQLESGNTAGALATVRSGIHNAANDEFRLKFMELESKAAFLRGDIKELYRLKDSIVALSNAISENKNREILQHSKLQFELSASNHELEISRQKTASQQKLYIISTLFLVIVLLTGSWAFYKKSQVARQKKELAESNLRIAGLELERERQKTSILNQKIKERELVNQLEKEKLRDKQQKLKYEINERNRQLSDKILFQTTRNELIEDIITKISGMPRVKEDARLVQSISSLKSHLKEDTRWDEFTSNFENVNSEFLVKLKKSHPELTANDVRFLSFIYLNLSTKEIAALLNISPESCRKRKERISRKLGVKPGESLYTYLFSL